MKNNPGHAAGLRSKALRFTLFFGFLTLTAANVQSIYPGTPAVVSQRIFTLYPIRQLVYRLPTYGRLQWIHDHQKITEIFSPEDSLCFQSSEDGIQIQRKRHGTVFFFTECCQKVRLEISPLNDADYFSTFNLTIPQHITRSFQGTLEIHWKQGGMEAIWETDPERLVASVVGAEMSNVSHTEALKAQAIVARSFIASHPGRHRHDGYDFCDTTHCQFSRGADTPPQAEAAAKATQGAILTYHGKPIPSYYSAVCRNLLFSTPPNGEFPSIRILCPYCARWSDRTGALPVTNPFSGAANGHHMGLCQAGCLEMALRGSTYRQILAHFFPASLTHSVNWQALLLPDTP